MVACNQYRPECILFENLSKHAENGTREPRSHVNAPQVPGVAAAALAAPAGPPVAPLDVGEVEGTAPPAQVCGRWWAGQMMQGGITGLIYCVYKIPEI